MNYMSKDYDLIFLTNLSSFYKINLYNEIAKKQKIFVIFMSGSSRYRDESFFKGEKKFEYTYLKEDLYENRSSLKNSFKLIKILSKIKYKKIAIGGWDSLENWTAWLISKKEQNALVVESSEFESTNKGIKGAVKKIFVKRISLCFVSGESQKSLLKNIGYRGKIIKTKGVGIFNYSKINKKIESLEKKIEIKKFLYVGRLSPEKNIDQIIRVFNKFSRLELNIVGYGPQEKELKKISNKNIKFYGKINNEKLSEIYQDNHVFVLPSKSEPWGLVVEEALYNGLPTILSDKVGCAKEIIENGVEGLIYDVRSDEELEKAILKIIELENYHNYKNNVQKINFDKIKQSQIEAYFKL